jgi:hypothetical protein
MRDKRSWEERSRDFEISFINLPFEVEPEVVEPETARERADRIWGMKSDDVWQYVVNETKPTLKEVK